MWPVLGTSGVGWVLKLEGRKLAIKMELYNFAHGTLAYEVEALHIQPTRQWEGWQGGEGGGLCKPFSDGRSGRGGGDGGCGQAMRDNGVYRRL